MTVTSFAAAALPAGLAVLTVGMGAAGIAEPVVPASAPGLVLASPPSLTGISWSWDWDDDDEDWGQTATWDCPATCSITFEDW